MIDLAGFNGLKAARKHIGWYLVSSGAPEAEVKAWRQRLCTNDNAPAVLADLAEFYARAEARADAGRAAAAREHAA
jgi:hypothetical protein